VPTWRKLAALGSAQHLLFVAHILRSASLMPSSKKNTTARTKMF
jgi:hypothetical protein